MNLKILTITSEFPPLPGGIGHHAYHLSKYLKKAGFDITVLTDVRHAVQDSVFDEIQPFSVYRIKRNRLTQLNRIQKAIQLARQSDVVICSGKFPLWLGAFLHLFFRRRFLAVLHGSELKAGGLVSQTLTKWSLRQFDALIAVSSFTKAYALTIDPGLSIEVVSNGIELETFTESTTKKAPTLNLVTVGNLTYRKGQQNVIKALPLLKEKFPQIHYHCVGIPTEIEKFSALAQSLDVLDCITFHGILTDFERNNILQQATVFVMLSDIVANDFEGFGIAILEANALGIPAIGSQDSGIADAIKNGYSGFLVNQSDPKSILDAVERILDDYSRLSIQAIDWSIKFDWNIVVAKYIKIMENEA